LGAFETLVFDEGIKRFTGILDLSAAFIFTVDAKMHSVPTTNRTQVWNHFIGYNSCNFYGVQKELELTICLNPEGGVNDNVFNAIEWTHDVISTTDKTTNYSSDIKNSSFADGTDNITYFSAWNDYLTSNVLTTTLASDIKRRFRISRLYIPRDATYPISRMRGQYLFIKIKYLPGTTNKSIFINDITLYYNALR
jgi:hypothetical protein